MIGSRHEKAAIVVASYVIGFVTAFILYGEFTASSTVMTVSMANENPAALAVAADNIKNIKAEKSDSSESNLVSYKDGALLVTLNGIENVLSFNPEISNLKADLEEMNQGFHYGNISYTESSDSRFVYFCERHDPTGSDCTAYVYDVDSDRIYPVTLDGEQVTLSENESSSVIWTMLGLKVGMNFSANPSAPWVLIAGE